MNTPTEQQLLDVHARITQVEMRVEDLAGLLQHLQRRVGPEEEQPWIA